MTLLILVKRKDGGVAITDFTEVEEKRRTTWPETRTVNSSEALELVRGFLGVMR